MTGTLTPDDLANDLIGGGIAISNVTYTGADVAAGRFSGGTGIIGFESGIILSSGDIANVVGPNTLDNITANNGTPGDTDLDLLSTFATQDAAVLEFDFVPQSETVAFQYVFASDEYNEWVNTAFNDVFAFFINGVNCATVDGDPVSINTINNGNPFDTDPRSHPELYVNNDLDDGGGAINTEMDGLTEALTCQASVTPDATNHIKLAIADASDAAFDSNVFLETGSFVDLPTPTPTATASAPTPTPTATATLPAPTPTPTATATASAPTPTPTATATLPAPTPTPTATATLPAPTPTPTATATASGPTPTPTATATASGPTPTPTATATLPAPTPTPGGNLTLTAGDDSVAPDDEVEVTATIVNDNGDPVAGVDCTFSIFSQPGDDATVDAGPVTTDADGKASTTLNAGSTPGIVEVQADCNGFSQILDVEVAVTLPQTAAGAQGSGGVTGWLIAALLGSAALAAAGFGALRLRPNGRP